MVVVKHAGHDTAVSVPPHAVVAHLGLLGSAEGQADSCHGDGDVFLGPRLYSHRLDRYGRIPASGQSHCQWLPMLAFSEKIEADVLGVGVSGLRKMIAETYSASESRRP